MRLDELFAAPRTLLEAGEAPDGGAPPLKDRLRQMAIDFLTPLVAHRVPFVTVTQVVDELRRARTGLLVDRALVMSLLDPEHVGAVKSIEGDRVNLQASDGIERKVDDDQAQNEVEKIKDLAKSKAQENIKRERG